MQTASKYKKVIDMIYKVSCYGTGEKKTSNEQLSEKKYEEVKQACEKLMYMEATIDYYNIVKDNIIDFLTIANQLTMNMGNASSEENPFTKLNRHMINLLSTFYSFIEFYESTNKDMWDKIKSKYYDNHFEYRFMYNLRKYMTHRGLSISEKVMTLKEDKMEIFTYINPDNLLKNGKGCFQKKVETELEEFAKAEIKIDVVTLTKKFAEIFCNIQKDIRDILIPSTTQAISFLESFLIGNFYDDSHTFIETESGDYIQSISEPIKRFLIKMEKEGAF